MTPSAPEQRPPIVDVGGGAIVTTKKKKHRTKSGVDPEEERRALKAEARTAALGAATDARRGTTGRGWGGSRTRAAPVEVGNGGAASAASRTAPSLAATRLQQPLLLLDGEQSTSFDSADQAIVRGSIMASRAVGEPSPVNRDSAARAFNDDGGDDASSYDLDLTSVAETTLPSVRTRASGAAAPQAQGLSVILEGSGEQSRQRRGKSQSRGVEDSRLQFADAAYALGEDEKDPNRGRSGTSGNKRRKKKKMAFPRSSILKIKIPKNRRGRSRSGGDSYSSSSSKSSSSRWSWMSPGKKKRKRNKQKKAQFPGLFGEDGENGGEDDLSLESTVLTKTRDATEDAWMCGLCGMAFRTHALAESHEVRCVRYAFGAGDVRLGYLPTLSDSATGRREPRTTTAANGWGAGGLSHTDHGASLVGAGMQAPMVPHPSSAPSGGIRPRSNSADGSFAYPTASAAFGTTFSAAPNAGIGGGFGRRSVGAGAVASSAAADDGNETRYEIRTAATSREPGAVHLSSSMRRCVVMTDEAVLKVSLRASSLVLAPPECDAERELALLARDREYYDALAVRSARRKRGFLDSSGGIFSRDGEGSVMGEIKTRFAEAYKLIKEDNLGSGGDGSGGTMTDVYSAKGTKRGASAMPGIGHDDGTLYINVIVKNGAQVINNELERLAKMRWQQEKEESEAEKAAAAAAGFAPRREFEWFRHFAQYNMVRLAGLALASDFTPRRIAVQLSNDLYRLMAPRLKKRGVSIETEIEYRVGAYFVLGVNIKEIDWCALMRYTHREVQNRKRRWREEKEKRELTEAENSAHPKDGSEGGGGEGGKDGAVGEKTKGGPAGWRIMYRLYVPTLLELIGQCLAWLHQLHWIVSVPVCNFWYHAVLRNAMRRYILASTTDEIFQYVEKKGMEMEMEVCEAWLQASFMLQALRELRADERELKKKKAEAESGEAGGVILGPLLGPAVKEDKGPAAPPAGWAPPENLEDVNFEMDLPVGFRRLRWALLNKDSTFLLEAVQKTEQGYENIVVGDWSEHHDHIGLPTLPATVKAEDVVGVSREVEYLMPKSAFVKANMNYEEKKIVEYNDHCFAYHGTVRSPEVPYGNTFLTHTLVVVTNKGGGKCQMVCSVEAEFPNGPPMIARQIKSGMRAGTAESFVALGETVCRYEDEYP